MRLEPRHRIERRRRSCLIQRNRPEPAELVEEPLTWKPFPVDALPEPLSSFVRDNAKAISCDAAFVALPTLAVVAACIGNTCRVLLKKGWTEAAVLWLATVGESGSLKSPSLRPALKPLYRIHQQEQTALYRIHQQEQTAYQQAVKVYELELVRHELEVAAWKRSKGAGDPPLAPEPPQARRLMVSDVTVEALAPLLQANPRGLLLVRDELAAWIGGFDRYAGGKGADGPAWLSMYDAGPILVDRKSGEPKSIFVPAAAVGVVGTIQPATLRRVFTPEYRENGTLARMLLAAPPNRPALWTDEEVGEEVEQKFAHVVETLLQLVPGVDDDGNPRPRLIPLNPEAKAAFVTWHDTHARELTVVSGDLAASYSKLKGACARFALIFHAVRVAAGDPSVDAACIDIVSLRSAIELAEWFKHEARRIYAMLAEDEATRVDRQNLDQLKRYGGCVSVREWQRMRSHHTAADAEAELNQWVQEGLGAWDTPKPDPRGGRPTKVFHMADVTDTDKTPCGDGSRGVVSVSDPSGANLLQKSEVFDGKSASGHGRLGPEPRP
jgi:hypothetical protein